VFTHLRNGTKTVEGRPYSKKYHAVKAGDVIAFKHGSSESVAVVCYGGFGSGGSWSPAVYEAVGRSGATCSNDNRDWRGAQNATVEGA
jgi:hypothetical protein